MVFESNENDIPTSYSYVMSNTYKQYNSMIYFLATVFMHLYVIWSICNILALYKFRNLYPIRGRAPILTIYQACCF